MRTCKYLQRNAAPRCGLAASRSLFERERGGAMVEFAFVFPILFLLIYGGIAYGYIFTVNESIHYAVKVGAESAVRVDPQPLDDGAPYADRVIAEARQAATRSLNWLPTNSLAVVTGEDSLNVEVIEGEVRVTIRFDVSEAFPFLRLVRLPLVGPAPPLPETLGASAIALI